MNGKTRDKQNKQSKLSIYMTGIKTDTEIDRISVTCVCLQTVIIGVRYLEIMRGGGREGGR